MGVIDPFGYRVGEHPEDDEDFSDIWDTNRGQGKKDKSKVWGTNEYFNRIDKERDEWDTRHTRETINRRIKRSTERIKRDTEKIRRDARRAAETVRSRAENRQMVNVLKTSQQFLKDFTPKIQKKKRKRRIKLSGKSIGIGTMIFWGLIIFNFCGDDKADKTANVVDTSNKIEVSQVLDKAREYSNAAITKVEEGLKELDKQGNEKPENVNDPYKQNDDRYGSIDDKW